MIRVRKLLCSNVNLVEIRDSEKGDFVWPSPAGVSLEQALDLI